MPKSKDKIRNLKAVNCRRKNYLPPISETSIEIMGEKSVSILFSSLVGIK